MVKLKTEDDLRKLLMQECRKYELRGELAEKIGVAPSFLSQVVNGAPLTGKIVEFLGYKKSRVRVYEAI